MLGAALLVAITYVIVNRTDQSSAPDEPPIPVLGATLPPDHQPENNLTPPPLPPDLPVQGDKYNNINNEEDEKREGRDQIVPPPELPPKRNERQEAIVQAMKHAWKGYKTYAWGHDHLKPITRTRDDWLNLGLT
ncbi:hypothetical protein SK128_018458, partial [Halocaridina rubra]